MQTPPSSPPVKPIIATGMVVAGLVIAFLGIFADVLGIGTGRGFGYYQMIVLISGIVLLLGGLALLLQRRASGDDDDEFEPEQ